MNCPTLVQHGASLVNCEAASIISLYRFRAGLTSSELSLWPAHQKENEKQFTSTNSCHHNYKDEVAVLKRYCMDSMVSTCAAEPVGHQRRAFVNIHRLVLLGQGLGGQEPIIPGHAEQRVLLGWAMNTCCPHLYDISACRDKADPHQSHGACLV